MDNVYVSTGAFQSRQLAAILALARDAGLHNIELSSGINYSDDIESLVMANRGHFRFLLHNYFPPPAEPFVLNLGSGDPAVVERCFELCRRAIDWSAVCGADFYAVHCGFSFDGTGRALGNKSVLDLPRIAMDVAFENFCVNISRLADYAEQQGIRLAIENNVINHYALIDGRNELCLGTNQHGLGRIFDRVGHANLGLLLDLAHAKVNIRTDGMDIDKLLQQIGDKIIAVHISDNDGLNDNNERLSADSDLGPYVRQLQHLPLVLEVFNLAPDEIVSQLGVIQSYLK